MTTYAATTATLAATILAAPAIAAEDGEPFKAEWESLKRRDPAPQWFRDAKFGIYFHWGVYSVPAYGSEWYPRNMHIKKRREYKHHVATYGEPTAFGYHDFVPRFKAEKFDAEAWADLFVRAGARFAGPVAEHHDGYAMWASKLTPWNAKDTGPKRDITGELAEAVRKRGLRLVATFHHARNNLWKPPGKDRWTGHYEFVKRDFPSILEDPGRAVLYGYMPREEFLEMWLGKLKEVVDAYRPDLIWFDSWLNEIPESHQKAFLAHYLNAARRWGREVVVTCKQRDITPEIVLEDFEKGRAADLTANCWLTDDTISRGSWCYTRGLKIKPAGEVLRVLIDIVSKNGQLLLNVSPKADGTIPGEQREVLLDLGDWLGRFGECIYGTRPWVVYGEGPTRMRKAGHFVGRVQYGAKDIRFTTRGDVLYAIFLGRPEGTATIASLAKGSGLYAGEPKRAALIGSDKALKTEWDGNGLHLAMPAKLPDDKAVAVRVEGLTIEGFTPERSVRFEGDRAVLGASAAELHGGKIAVERKDAGRPSLGFWDSPSDRASWQVRFPAPGAYEVRARMASLKPAGFEVRVGEAKLAATSPKTGDWGQFETVRLGTLKVAAAGTQRVEVVPVADGWSAMNLSRLELVRKP